ncbi:hypothetical protein CKO51_18130 [Rhodopirellula sp. SM50]|nr:hypothetical protein CKO51_18130 [Rhodopirellula sp. SM50]
MCAVHLFNAHICTVIRSKVTPFQLSIVTVGNTPNGVQVVLGHASHWMAGARRDASTSAELNRRIRRSFCGSLAGVKGTSSHATATLIGGHSGSVGPQMKML